MTTNTRNVGHKRNEGALARIWRMITEVSEVFVAHRYSAPWEHARTMRAMCAYK